MSESPNRDPDSLLQAYRLLGVKRHATVTEIHQAYRRRIDRDEQAGEGRSREIWEAYDAIRFAPLANSADERAKPQGVARDQDERPTITNAVIGLIIGGMIGIQGELSEFKPLQGMLPWCGALGLVLGFLLGDLMWMIFLFSKSITAWRLFGGSNAGLGSAWRYISAVLILFAVAFDFRDSTWDVPILIEQLAGLRK